jgi:hypothetical protein
MVMGELMLLLLQQLPEVGEVRAVLVHLLLLLRAVVVEIVGMEPVAVQWVCRCSVHWPSPLL